jgi:hypothetical protein
MKATICAAVLAAAMMAGPASAAELDISSCTFPATPAVPDGAQASEADMIAAGSAVRAYIAGTEQGLECLTAAQDGLGAEITPEQQQRITTAHDGAVDAMSLVAEGYNAAVRAYRAANP